MQQASDRSKDVRVKVETQGRWTRIAIELRDVPRTDRERLRATADGVATALWARFERDERGPEA